MSESAAVTPPDGRLRSWRKRVRRRWKHKPGAVPWLLWQPQRALLFLVGLLPVRAQLACADRLARVAWWSPRRRRTGRLQIAQALPHLAPGQRDRILRASCGHLGRAAIEVMSVAQRFGPRLAERVVFEPGARATLDALRGRPLIAVQPHLGSVDLGGAGLAIAGLHPAFPMRLPTNWYLAQRMIRAREGYGVKLLPRQGALRGLLAHLKSGGCAVLATDQNAHHAPIFVDWFGKAAATERAAAALALRAGTPVLVFWCIREREPGRWRIGCALVRAAAAPALADDDAVRDLTLRMHREMERAILRCPEQYLWIHDRYRTRPAGEIGVARA